MLLSSFPIYAILLSYLILSVYSLIYLTGMALQSQGNHMCLLRSKKNVPKGECNQEYGILMHNMEEDSFFGTCLMQDGRYVTLSWQDLNKAFKKVLEYDYVISPTIEKLCQDLYNAAMVDVLALEHQIEISQCAYQQAKANATLARQAKRAAY